MSVRAQIRAALLDGKATVDDIAKHASVLPAQVRNNLGPLMAEGKVVNLGNGYAARYALGDWPPIGRITPKRKHNPETHVSAHGAQFSLSPQGNVQIGKNGQQVELVRAETAELHEFLIRSCPVWDPR